MAAFSLDLRQRVLDAVLRSDDTERAVADRFSVSRPFAQKLKRLAPPPARSPPPRPHAGHDRRSPATTAPRSQRWGGCWKKTLRADERDRPDVRAERADGPRDRRGDRPQRGELRTLKSLELTSVVIEPAVGIYPEHTAEGSDGRHEV